LCIPFGRDVAQTLRPSPVSACDRQGHFRVAALL
jgi:hypothetical protein